MRCNLQREVMRVEVPELRLPLWTVPAASLLYAGVIAGDWIYSPAGVMYVSCTQCWTMCTRAFYVLTGPP